MRSTSEWTTVAVPSSDGYRSTRALVTTTVHDDGRVGYTAQLYDGHAPAGATCAGASVRDALRSALETLDSVKRAPTHDGRLHVSRTSGRDRGLPPCAGAYRASYTSTAGGGKAYAAEDWFIDLPTMPDLLTFTAAFGPIILRSRAWDDPSCGHVEIMDLPTP